MYTITFWRFAKRNNSTARPPSDGVTINCELMDNSGIINPSAMIDFGNTNPTTYNYAYISEFSRYYYIKDWQYNAGLWICFLGVDVLASWKNEIGGYSGYVLRSSAESDGTITDTFYPAKTQPTHSVKIINLQWEDELSNGRYVVGIVSGGNANTGSVSYYVMTTAQFNAFCNAIYDNTNDWLNAANITDITDELLKVLFNPFEYIVGVQWFPLAVPALGTVNSIPLGWWDIPVSASRLYSEAITFSDYSVTPDPHPQAATRGAYLNSAPYTSLTLDFQPFGMIPLDASIVCGKTIVLNVYIDYISGAGCLHITLLENQTATSILYSCATQIGTPIQISGRQPSIASMIAGGIAAVGEGIGLNQLENVPGIGGAISTAGNVLNAVSTGLKRMTSTGSNGNRAQILPEAFLSQDYLLLTDENNGQFGRPLYKNRQISAIPGYIKCGDPILALPASDYEITQAENYMRNGFFYE